MNKELIRPLTALRFYAAFVVFSLHAHMLPGLDWLGHPHAELQGRLGVSVFFVLSGFIMTYVYYGDGKYEPTGANAARFIIARVTRIFPLHWITLLICLPLGLSAANSMEVRLSLKGESTSIKRFAFRISSHFILSPRGSCSILSLSNFL